MENQDDAKSDTGKLLTRYLNNSIPAESVDIWPAVNHRLRSHGKDLAKPRRTIWKWAYGIVVVSTLLIAIISTNQDWRNSILHEINSNGKNVVIFQPVNGKVSQNESNKYPAMAARSIPIPFAYPIETVAESYPVHPGQVLTIQPKGKDWNGQNVKLYYLPETDSNEDQLLYKKVLPQNAQYIGETAIKAGKWSFQWQAPSQQNGGYGSFLIAALSNNGIVSGTRLTTLNYNNFELTPSSVQIGQKVELKGSGFPTGDVRIDLLQNRDSVGTAFQTTIGTTYIANGSFDYSFVLSPQVNGNVIRPGVYEVQAVVIRPNQQREGVFVNLTVH